ncbi:unnamed protein product [Chrysoparadoxa australica]
MKMLEDGVPTTEEWLSEPGNLPINGKGPAQNIFFSISSAYQLLQMLHETPLGLPLLSRAPPHPRASLLAPLRLTTVGVDPFLVACGTAHRWREKFRHQNSSLSSPNCVDAVWPNQPGVPHTPVFLHPLKYAGKGSAAKLEELRKSLKDLGTSAMVVSALDEVAWLLNIRGGDIRFTPVTTAYVVVTLDECTLFIDPTKLSEEVNSYLQELSIKVAPYDSCVDFLTALGKKVAADRDAENLIKSKVLLDPQQTSLAVQMALSQEVILEKASPLSLAKALKNDAELEGLRNSHIRDGVALTRLLAWLERAMADGEKLDEIMVSDKLEEFKGEQEGYKGPSFETISAYGSNAAIIHYKATKKSSRPLGYDSFYLLDCGGQYCDGTTDVTRTVHFGTPSDYQKRCYTLVLKGHIAIATAVFPEATTGSKLDVLARFPLWQDGLDYRHGTGHGVGAYLGVHEGPQGIHYRIRPTEQGFRKGMTTSNEPGYYEDGKFGLRIESVCICCEYKAKNSFGGKSSCQLQTITMAPIQRNLIDASLLTSGEKEWLNKYQSEVKQTLLPLLTGVDPLACGYIERETVPV